MQDNIVLHTPNLHSNMDRFERQKIFIFVITVTIIYIPIWIDLKGNWYFCKAVCCLYLHSNMDRFERFSVCHAKHYPNIIYIPIWIDLKVCS